MRSDGDGSLDDTVAPADVNATRDSARRVPQTIAGRFEIRGELGRGAFGVVYRAFDTVSRDEVAIKVIDVRSPELAERVRRELRSARKVTHVNVVRLHDLMDDGDRLVLGMELIDGDNLERVLIAERLPIERVLQMARQIAAGVASAHAVGVIHRDLKPANVMVRKDTGACVVTDFGIARPVEGHAGAEATREGDLVGTPLYMAPEQLVGSTAVGPRADVYALGLILYEIASGARPHNAPTLSELATLRLTAAPPDLAAVRADAPRGLVQLVERCLASRPEDRYADAGEVVEALAAIQSDGSAAVDIASARTVAATSVPSAVDRVTRRRGVPLYALGGLALIVALGVGGVVWSRRDSGASLRPPLKVHVMGSVPTGAHEWATRTAIVLFGEHLNAHARRFQVVGSSANPDLHVELAVTKQKAGVRLDLRLGPPGKLAPFVTKEGPGIAHVAGYAGIDLVKHLEAGRREREPTIDEKARMDLLGARNLSALLRYEYGIATRAADYLNQAANDDPGWAHPRAALLYASQLFGTPPTSTAKGEVDPARDPVGHTLISVLSDAELTRDPARVEAIVTDKTCGPGDRLCRLVRMTFGSISDERILANAQAACGPRFEDYQACGEVLAILGRFGMEANARTFASEWAASAPDSQSAVVSDALQQILAGNEAAVPKAIEQLSILDAERTLTTQAALHLAIRDFSAAADAATRLGGRPGELQESRYLLGTVFVAQGAFDRAVGMFRELATTGEREIRDRAYESLVDLQIGIGDREAAIATLDAWLSSPEPPGALAELIRRYQRDVLAGQCPDITARVASIDDAATRALVVQSLRRTGAEHGCAKCADVVRDGTAGFHRPSSNVAFARCALAEGQLDLAQQVLERERRLLMPSLVPGISPSPLSACVARLHLAEVFIAKKQPELAKRELDSLLADWAKVDRASVPVVERARKLRTSLR